MYIVPPQLKGATNPVSYRDAYSDILQQHRRAPQTSASSIMILVAPDVDALCAARMLETLLRQDNITHRIRPVAGLTALVDVKNELLDYHDVSKSTRSLRCYVLIILYLQLHTLILVNIGAFLDLPSDEWFGTFPEHLKIHVIDSQRPLNLSSLFGGGPAERIIVWDDGGIEKLQQEREAWFALEVSRTLRLDVSISSYTIV
jgi:cell division control protein 45